MTENGEPSTNHSGATTTDRWLVCLCASWCTVCREWQPTWTDWAQHHPDLTITWLDIEDEADLLDDLGIEIDNFPTVLLAERDRALFLGPIDPRLASVTRLAARLSGTASPEPALATAHALASHLWTRRTRD